MTQVLFPGRRAAILGRFAGVLMFFGSGAPSRGATPSELFPGVGFEQRIGERLPLGGRFIDDRGRTVRFGELLGGGPSVLIFGYSRCPQLCSVVAAGAVQTLRVLRARAGTDYHVIYVSIDPTDRAPELSAMKRRDLAAYGRPSNGDGWSYISGDEPTVRELARAAGFFYSYDPREKLYSHAAGFVVVTPDGRLSRYFLGVDYAPNDVMAALERAGQGKTGESAYELLLLCARGAGVAGRHGKAIWAVIQASVVATALALFGGVGWMLLNERRSLRKGAGQ